METTENTCEERVFTCLEDNYERYEVQHEIDEEHLRRESILVLEEEVGRQRQGMDRPGVRQIPEGSGEQGKLEETGCEIIGGAPATSRLRVR